MPAHTHATPQIRCLSGAWATRLTLLALLAVGLPAQAQPNPTAAELERSLSGLWTGALEYRDYQSNRQEKLPMQTRLSVGPDQATLTRLSTFDDGPRVGNVFITTVSLFNAAGTRVTSAMFRHGRDVEMVTDEAAVTTWQDNTRWTVVYQRQGIDGGQAADIRVTQSRSGAVLKAVKEVKPAGAPDSAWAFRNQTVLTLQP